MTKIKFYIVILILLACVVSCKSQNNIVKSISIYYVDYEILTTFLIKETYFEKAFNDDIKYFKIQDSSKIVILTKLIKKLTVQNNIQPTDVRQKVKIIMNDNTKINISLDGESSITKDGIVMKFNKKLQDLINEEIKKHEGKLK